MRRPVRDQDPLYALAGLYDGFLTLPADSVRQRPTGAALADDLRRNHGASPDLVRKISQIPSPIINRLLPSNVLVLELRDGTLNCSTLLAVAVPQAGRAVERQIGRVNAGCANLIIGGKLEQTPALLIEDDGTYTTDFTHAMLTIALLNGTRFAPPCSVHLTYELTFKARDAFCDGLDCAFVAQKAEALAARRDGGADADALGEGAIPPGATRMAADYATMAGLAKANSEDEAVPTLGGKLSATGNLNPDFNKFTKSITFPISFGPGQIYLARLGHAHQGWRESPNYLLGIYRFGNNQLVPVAGIVIEAHRSRIVSVEAGRRGR